MTAFVDAARARGLKHDLWGLEPSEFGVRSEDITTRVDVRNTLDRKLAALRSYESQLEAGHLLVDLPRDLAERFLGVEYFVNTRRREPDGDALLQLVSRVDERHAGATI
jgi:LmbE family N-acetylglucosaminyl deacetylase